MPPVDASDDPRFDALVAQVDALVATLATLAADVAGYRADVARLQGMVQELSEKHDLSQRELRAATGQASDLALSLDQHVARAAELLTRVEKVAEPLFPTDGPILGQFGQG